VGKVNAKKIDAHSILMKSCKKSLKILIITIPLMLILPSCFHYSSSTAEDPFFFSDFFVPSALKEAQNNANEVCAKFTHDMEGTMLKDGDKLQHTMDEILDEVTTSYKIFEESNRSLVAYHRLNFFKDVPIKIRIFSISSPLSLSYPNGEIHFSRSILDGGLSYSAKNKAQLVGLVVHEFIHVIQGHVGYQWATIMAYEDFQKKRFLSQLTNLTSILPLSYQFNVYSTRDLSEIMLTNLVIENIADVTAILLLEYMGYNPEEYINILKGLLLHTTKNVRRENTLWLYHRINCLEQMLSVKPSQIPRCLVTQGTDYSKTYKKLFIIPDSPFSPQYVGYWNCVLSKLGKQPYMKKFVVYGTEGFLAIDQVSNYASPLRKDGRLIYPTEICDGLVFTENICVFYPFPFVR
jgi:hypothetical protein